MSAPARFRTFQIDGDRLVSWDAFHSVFAEVFEFPDYYGRNNNAWIDCMTHLDKDGPVGEGEVVLLEITKIRSLKECSSEILDFILYGSAFVNGRRRELGEPPLIAISEGL